jgi:hypothetical protein
VKAALAALKFYKAAISPLLPNACRFLPTCSGENRRRSCQLQLGVYARLSPSTLSAGWQPANLCPPTCLDLCPPLHPAPCTRLSLLHGRLQAVRCEQGRCDDHLAPTAMHPLGQQRIRSRRLAAPRSGVYVQG